MVSIPGTVCAGLSSSIQPAIAEIEMVLQLAPLQALPRPLPAKSTPL
jgi:hypothetical protein